MAHVISDDCVMCGTCEGECPVGAISAGDTKYVINVQLLGQVKLFIRESDSVNVSINEAQLYKPGFIYFY